jgi:murein DD-endopeptidase MepM/ murein hydrolase activator NlpD
MSPGRALLAAFAGLALLFVAPFRPVGYPATPVNDVLGALATPAPRVLDADGAASHARAERDVLARHPDPGGAEPPDVRWFAPPVQILTGYRWPIHNARLTLPFGPTPWGSRVVDGQLLHDGIDLATFCGDRVRAAHAGTVLAAGRRYDEFIGWLGDLTAYTARLDEKHLWTTLPIVVVIDDGNDYRSIYAHFGKVVVKPGDVVAAGDLIGYEGRTGRASGCHVHYGLFSPDEVGTFGLDPVAAAHMLLPTELIARVDPLLVLPPLEDAGIH